MNNNVTVSLKDVKMWVENGSCDTKDPMELQKGLALCSALGDTMKSYTSVLKAALEAKINGTQMTLDVEYNGMVYTSSMADKEKVTYSDEAAMIKELEQTIMGPQFIETKISTKLGTAYKRGQLPQDVHDIVDKYRVVTTQTSLKFGSKAAPKKPEVVEEFTEGGEE